MWILIVLVPDHCLFIYTIPVSKPCLKQKSCDLCCIFFLQDVTWYEKKLFMPYANIKDADQPAPPLSLISIFVIPSTLKKLVGHIACGLSVLSSVSVTLFDACHIL